MATIPTPPTFASNDSSIANLQALSDCAKFVAVADSGKTNTRPLWHFTRTTTLAVAANTWTSVTCDANRYDTDGIYTSSGASATIRTQGYYAVEFVIPFQHPATSGVYGGRIQLTTGANSNRGAGVVTNHITTGMFSGTSDDISANASEVIPYCLYPLDKLVLQAFTANAATLDVRGTIYSPATSNSQVTFTGRWVRIGP